MSYLCCWPGVSGIGWPLGKGLSLRGMSVCPGDTTWEQGAVVHVPWGRDLLKGRLAVSRPGCGQALTVC